MQHNTNLSFLYTAAMYLNNVCSTQGSCIYGDFLNTTHSGNGSVQNLRHSFTLTVLFSAVVSTLSLCTILGNLTVVAAFTRDPKMRKIRNYYILNLAICDLFVGGFVTVFALVNELFTHWDLGLPFCKVWLCVDYILSCETVLTVLLICWDRLLMTSRPLQYMARQTSRRAVMKILMSWMCSILLHGPAIMLDGLFDAHPLHQTMLRCNTRVLHNPVFMGIKTVLEFIVPLVLTVCMIVQIIRNIHYKTLTYSIRQRVIRFKDGSTEPAPVTLTTVSQMCSARENVLHGKPHIPMHPCFYVNPPPPGMINYNSYRKCTCPHRTFNDGVSQVAALSVQYSTIPLAWWPWKGHHHQIGNYRFCQRATPWRTCNEVRCEPSTTFPERSRRRKFAVVNKPVEVTRSGIRTAKFQRLCRFLVALETVNIVSWTPITVGVWVRVLCASCISDTVYQLLYWVLYYNSAIRPFVYALILKRYAMNFQKIWCPCKREWDKASNCSEINAKGVIKISNK